MSRFYSVYNPVVWQKEDTKHICFIALLHKAAGKSSTNMLIFDQYNNNNINVIYMSMIDQCTFNLFI